MFVSQLCQRPVRGLARHTLPKVLPANTGRTPESRGHTVVRQPKGAQARVHPVQPQSRQSLEAQDSAYKARIGLAKPIVSDKTSALLYEIHLLYSSAVPR
jgi:hypothetical protein